MGLDGMERDVTFYRHITIYHTEQCTTFSSPHVLIASCTLALSLRRRHLKGMQVLVSMTGGGLGSLLPQLLTCLSAPIRDEDAAVRTGTYTSFSLLFV